MNADGLAPKPDNGAPHEVVWDLYARFGDDGFFFPATVDPVSPPLGSPTLPGQGAACWA